MFSELFSLFTCNRDLPKDPLHEAAAEILIRHIVKLPEQVLNDDELARSIYLRADKESFEKHDNADFKPVTLMWIVLNKNFVAPLFRNSDDWGLKPLTLIWVYLNKDFVPPLSKATLDACKGNCHVRFSNLSGVSSLCKEQYLALFRIAGVELGTEIIKGLDTLNTESVQRAYEAIAPTLALKYPYPA